jgi:hypothetical protein
LLLKFEGCDDVLSLRFGVLGQLHNAGKRAPQVAAAVRKAVQAICTWRMLHPSCNALRPGVVASSVALFLVWLLLV